MRCAYCDVVPKKIQKNISQFTIMNIVETSDKRVGGACSGSANGAHVKLIDCFLLSLTTKQML